MSNFRQDLRKSQENARSPVWEARYREFFPSYERGDIVETLSLQRLGRDRCIFLSDNTFYWVEEKVDYYDNWDFPIETWSTMPTDTKEGHVGWAEKLETDWLVFMKWEIPGKPCLFVRYAEFRDWWKKDGYLVQRYHAKRTQTRNGTYTSEAYIVPMYLFASLPSSRWVGRDDTRPPVLDGCNIGG
jgi:hypothetical protein